MVGQAEKCVATIAAVIAVGATADLALDDLAADVALRAVGVEWYLRVVERHQQLGLVGMQPREQAIGGGEPGAAGEDAIETCAHLAAAPGRRLQSYPQHVTALGNEVVLPVDQQAHHLPFGC